jgi:hypothetical protein
MLALSGRSEEGLDLVRFGAQVHLVDTAGQVMVEPLFDELAVSPGPSATGAGAP